MEKGKNINIKKHIHRFLKLQADYEGTKLNKLIEKILDGWLKDNSKFKKEYLKELKEVSNEKK